MEESKRRTMIYKKIKYHLSELKRLRPEYTFVMIALQGSQNYNLDIYSDEYKSDIDTIAVVLPTFKDFVNNNKMISETLVLDSNEHIDCKDIRLLFELFKKQNIKYLEILFTDFRIINPLFRKEVIKLYEDSEEIAHYHIDKLIRTTFGMAMEKHKAMEHPYEGLKDKIEKYGYDPKQLHHIIRLSEFLYQYCTNGSFKFAIDSKNYSKEIYELLMEVKTRKYNLKEAREMAENYIGLITELRNEYEGNLSYAYFFKKDVVKLLEETQDNIFQIYFKDLFTIKPEKSDNFIDLDPNHYRRVFVTSDIHFCHENILGFEDNRWTDLLGINKYEVLALEMKKDGLSEIEIYNILNNKSDEEKLNKYKRLIQQKYIDLHDEMIVKRWNQTVASKDLVYILGDIALNYHDINKVNELMNSLNGIKILIIGNHDEYTLQNHKFNKSVFAEIVNYKEIKYHGRYISMFHYPIARFNKQDKIGLHLYGHIHSTVLENPIPHAYNVGMDMNNYRPQLIDNFIELDKENNIKTDHHNDSGLEENYERN